MPCSLEVVGLLVFPQVDTDPDPAPSLLVCNQPPASTLGSWCADALSLIQSEVAAPTVSPDPSDLCLKANRWLATLYLTETSARDSPSSRPLGMSGLG